MGTRNVHNDPHEELSILKHAVENTNEAFVTIDESHKVLIFNQAAEKIFGYGRNEVIDSDLDVIMTPACSRDHRNAVKRYVETRAPKPIAHATEVVASRKDGSTFPASISFSVTQVNGRFFFTGIVRDETETRRLQEQILQSERLAALGRLVAEITHEIKNPLMMIGGFARQLIRSSKRERDLKKLNIIANEVKRLEDLLVDLREFYLPKKQVVRPVHLKKLFEEIFSLVKADFQRQNVRAELRLDDRALVVSGDPDRLKQVFLNLVKNSIEAMDQGGKLTIETKKAADCVEIHVTDEGCGIPEEDMGNIFSPFFTTKRHGTGLGLCISKRILEENKGSSFSVKSIEGKGTVFTIRLPLYQGSGKKTPILDLIRCNDCESCLQTCPEVFRRNEETGLIEVRDLDEYPEDKLQEAINVCPADCISLEDSE